ALYRKYRPNCFSDVVGQEHITETIKSQLNMGKIFHAYLFTGPRGTGKTSCAKILAKAVNCLSPQNGDACLECESCKRIESGETLDIAEIDAASNNGVDNIRELREQVNFTPVSSKYRVYIIDEVHMLSIGAFNALLKTLEEPPPHIVFILATTEVHKLPATILSRCQRFDFHRIDAEVVCDRIKSVAAKESIEIEDEAAMLMASMSDGGMRDALGTLDLCAAHAEKITVSDVEKACALAGNDYLRTLADFIKDKNSSGALECVHDLYKNAVDMQRLCEELILHYRNLMIAKTVRSPEGLITGSAKELELIKKQAAQYEIELIMCVMRVLSDTLGKMNSANRKSELELALIKACNPSLSDSNEALLYRVSQLEKGIPAVKKSMEQPADNIRETAKPVLPVSPKDDNISRADIPESGSFYESRVEQTASVGEQRLTQWPQILKEIQISCPILGGVLQGSSAYLRNDALLIDYKNDQFVSLIKNETYRAFIRNAAMNVLGKSYKLGPYKPSHKADAEDPLGNIISKLEELEIPAK
ncbi:MAG: DNA polymerase III subunit gamma/tau, partial [Oscillospiraceae bacterium]